MPELPEVETICRTLKSCEGQRFLTVFVYREDMIRQKDFEISELEGNSCMRVERQGKYLEFLFPKDRYLTFHLGMSGRLWKSTNPEEAYLKHIHMQIILEQGEMLLFYDPRRFGGIWLTEGHSFPVQKLGIEPLGKNFQADILYEKAVKRNAAIKQVLLDQKFIAGLGNIYADESLFAAGIHPKRSSREVTLEEWKSLQQNIVRILKESIVLNGTTFRDYRDGLNQKGAFQDFLKVYGKKGQPCPNCLTPLERVRIAQRSSCYCPKCQN